MRDEILSRSKRELLTIISNLKSDNINESSDMVTTYFNLLKTLNKLPIFDDESSGLEDEGLTQSEQQQDLIEQSEQSKAFEQDIVIENENVHQVPVYIFERKLYGGRISNLDNGYTISERIVRSQGIRHGDMLVISASTKIGEKGITRYSFDIAESNYVAEPPNRVQINMCVVEKDDSIGLIVRRSVNSEISINGSPYTFIISERDIANNNLQEGDIVDIAFYETNLETLKVIWKYETKSQQQSIATSNKRPKKTRTDYDESERSIPIDHNLFIDKTITIIGAEYFRLTYQRVFDRLNINMNHLTGDEGKIRLEKFIKKSDVVIVIIEYVSHNASYTANELCKTHNVPFVSAERDGAQYMLLEAEKALRRKLGLDESA